MCAQRVCQCIGCVQFGLCPSDHVFEPALHSLTHKCTHKRMHITYYHQNVISSIIRFWANRKSQTWFVIFSYIYSNSLRKVSVKKSIRNWNLLMGIWELLLFFCRCVHVCVECMWANEASPIGFLYVSVLCLCAIMWIVYYASTK